MSLLITCPTGVVVFAHACSAVFAVQFRDYSLYIPEISAPVSALDELIVEYRPGHQHVAERFAETLCQRGYQVIEVRSSPPQHDLGGGEAA